MSKLEKVHYRKKNDILYKNSNRKRKKTSDKKDLSSLGGW